MRRRSLCACTRPCSHPLMRSSLSSRIRSRLDLRLCERYSSTHWPVLAICQGVAMKRILIAMVLIASSVQCSLAYYKSGNELYRYCVSDKITAAQIIAGITDGIYSVNELFSVKHFCIPDYVELGQIADIVCKDLSNHPEQRHWPAANIAHASLIRSFPCQ